MAEAKELARLWSGKYLANTCREYFLTY